MTTLALSPSRRLRPLVRRWVAGAVLALAILSVVSDCGGGGKPNRAFMSIDPVGVVASH